jgi:glycosyltransferase involved in cell wall biosynthesis
VTSCPLNVVLLISASGWRGSGVSFAKIAHGLADRGHRILVVTRTPPVTAGFVADGIPATELQLRNTGLSEVSRLRRVLGRHRAQAVMADTPRDLRLSVLAALFTRRRVVYRYNMNYRRPRTDFGDRLYTRRVAATVYLSEFIQHEARAAGVRLGGTAHLIPNGFDTDIFAPDPQAALAFRTQFRLADGDLVVLTAGKLVRGKRLDRSIDALARVRLQDRRVTYVLCGDGPEEAELKKEAEQAGVRVLFTGMIDQKTLRAAYNAADVVLHPGRETFGNVLGEAMSCGRPVISVQEGAAPEVIGPNGLAGALVPPDDADALASALTHLLNDAVQRQRMGLAARQRIEQVFPLHRMVSGYEDMFAAILDHR